jgi:hypothetical protein
MSRDALRHIEHLSVTIGPRGSCTEQERRASDYCAQVLRDLGYDVRVQPFRAARSGWAPFSIGSGLMLIALLKFHISPALAGGLVIGGLSAGRLVAAALALAVTVSILLQLAFRPNPLAWLTPQGTSQNVYAVARPRGERRRTVVVSGHVDTHRTPLAMASPLAFRLFQALTTLSVISFVALAGLLALAVVRPDLYRLQLALPPAAIVAVVLLVTLQPEFSRYVPGANDNASGAAAVLALAARLKASPLDGTEVWLLNSGAEETGATGPVRLLEEHPELRDADWLILDNIAGSGAGPCLITAEHVLLPMHADPSLLAAARAVAAARPDLGAYEHYYRGLFSEHSPLTAAGCRSLALINFTPQGVLPDWHRPTDTFDRVDPGVLDRTEEFAWALLGHMDGSGRGQG